MMQNILIVPVTSMSTKWVFSVAGRTADDRRYQLKSDTVEGLTFFVDLRSSGTICSPRNWILSSVLLSYDFFYLHELNKYCIGLFSLC